KRERFAVFEVRSAVEANTRDAKHRELYSQYLALFTVGVVAGGAMNCRDFTVRKGIRVKLRGLLGLFVEPQAYRVLRGHVHLRRLLRAHQRPSGSNRGRATRGLALVDYIPTIAPSQPVCWNVSTRPTHATSCGARRRVGGAAVRGCLAAAFCHM